MITVLSCKQAADRLHLSVPEVKNLSLSGKIPFVFYGGKARFIEAKIEEWWERCTGDGGNSTLQKGGEISPRHKTAQGQGLWYQADNPA
jgi:excisionase family DNA binding protein